MPAVPENKINMTEVTFLKENVVQPMIDAIKREVQPVVDAAKLHEERIAKLESNQKKALTGYTAFVSVVSTGLALVASQLKVWFSRKVSGK